MLLLTCAILLGETSAVRPAEAEAEEEEVTRASETRRGRRDRQRRARRREQRRERQQRARSARKRETRQAARQRASRQRAARQRASRQRAARKRAARQRASRQRAARKRAARQRASRQRAARKRAARQRASRAAAAKPQRQQPPQPAAEAEAACLAALRQGGVAHERVSPKAAPGVAYPIRLTGPVGGVRIHGARRGGRTSYLDCRLARALLAWAPTLRAAGVVGIRHYSMYRGQARVAGSARRSGHAGGMAIDAGRFELEDGEVLDVLSHWRDKRRGADPCAPRPAEPAPGRTMRQVVCRAAELGLFTIIVTPHYNRAHRNHVHLEVTGPRTPRWMH